MRASDFTLIALDVLALLSALGAWLWTRADRKKAASSRTEPKP
jgi:hypothetical protein